MKAGKKVEHLNPSDKEKCFGNFRCNTLSNDRMKVETVLKENLT